MTEHSQGPAAAWWLAPRHDGDDEPPFTDFGHLGYGRLDLRVLWNDIWWVDIAGSPHVLADMSRVYRANVIAFLRRGAPGWWYHVLTYSTLETALLLSTCPDAPATRQALDLLERLAAVEPQAWIEASPLMRRLHDLPSGDQGNA